MRGLWTPVRLALMRSPKIRELARALNCDRDSALGAAVRWLGFVTEQCNSACTHLTEAELDEELQRQGLANALQRIGWVSVTKEGVVLVVEHSKHSCDKVLTAARVADFRARQQQDCNGNVTPNVTLPPLHTRQDKTRQEKGNPSSEPYPQTKADVLGALEQDTTVQMPKEHLDRFAQDFLDSVAASGWLDSRGRAIRDWRAFLSKFARNYADRIKPAARNNHRNNNSNATHVNEY